jgi:D-galactarate dehydratase / Altronate hydrolase, C terminus
MDLNCGAILDGQATIESMGREIFDALLRAEKTISASTWSRAPLWGRHTVKRRMTGGPTRREPRMTGGLPNPLFTIEINPRSLNCAG